MDFRYSSQPRWLASELLETVFVFDATSDITSVYICYVYKTDLISCTLPNVFQIAGKQMDLKKKLKVTFAGEPGLDMGGLTKEWFLLLVRQIFQPEYGNVLCALKRFCSSVTYFEAAYFYPRGAMLARF